LLACRLPDRIAALATVSGAFYPDTEIGCDRSPVPVVDFHGTGDRVIDYDGGVSHETRYSSIPAWLREWASRDRCAGSANSPIGPDVTAFVWNGCARGTDLVHYRVAGGGHTWPGASEPSGPGGTTRTISATSILWDFFVAHPLSGRSS
jgi:polyhydroxybutyrate depolymerase